MDTADLYLNSVEIGQYLNEKECLKCGVETCKDLVDKLRHFNLDKNVSDYLPPNKLKALETALNKNHLLPVVPKLTFPRPVEIELVEINQPKDGDPIIVTGNNQYTQEVLLTIFASTISSFYILFSDTNGDTLDMAIIYDSFTTESIKHLFEQSGLSSRNSQSTIIIPGKAGKIADSLHQQTKLPIEIGPVCAAELPLFFGDRWISR